MSELPPPTRVRFGSRETEGYYFGTQDRAGNITRPEGEPYVVLKDKLPAPEPGMEWTKLKNTRGEIYFVQQDAATGELMRADAREKAKRDEQDAAREREQRAEQQRAEAEAAARGPEYVPGQTNSYDHMVAKIQHMTKGASEYLGATLKVKGPVSGVSSPSLRLGGELDTGAGGRKVGPVSIASDGVPTAVHYGSGPVSATLTSDGRFIGKGGVKIGKGKVEVAAAVDVGEATTQGLTEATEAVVEGDWGQRARQLGKTTAGEGGGGGG